jgi:hypothetical protein
MDLGLRAPTRRARQPALMDHSPGMPDRFAEQVVSGSRNVIEELATNNYGISYDHPLGY